VFCIDFLYLRDMFYQNDFQKSFAGNYVERRIRRNTFYKQINLLIDWSEIENEIKKVFDS
jgi:hypothetical protein